MPFSEVGESESVVAVRLQKCQTVVLGTYAWAKITIPPALNTGKLMQNELTSSKYCFQLVVKYTKNADRQINHTKGADCDDHLVLRERCLW